MPVAPQGYEAHVETVEGRLEEFKIEHEGASSTTCYIPCEAGKEFTITCTLPQDRIRQTNHSIQIDLDGKKITLMSNVLRQSALYENKEMKFSANYTRDYATFRNFQFGSLELTDDETYLGGSAAQFGKITVRITTAMDYILKPLSYQNAPQAQDDYRIHEKSKKGIAHCVKFGEQKRAASSVQNVLHAVGTQVVHTFVFQYRHMDLLIADGIAPRRKASNPFEMAAANANDRLASGKRKAEERKVQVGGSSSDVKRVKKETKPTIVPGEIIDLTDMPLDGNEGVRVKKERKMAPIIPGEVIDLT